MNRVLLLMVAAVTITISSPAVAGDTAEYTPAAHNAGYERGLTFGTSPQTVGEMLLCAAMWDRWDYILESTADPNFAKELRTELSAKYTASRKRYWQRQARRSMREDDDLAYFEEARGEAENSADKYYGEYASGSDRGLSVMMEYLAIC